MEEKKENVEEKEIKKEDASKPKQNNKGLIITLIVIIVMLVAALIYMLFFNDRKQVKGNDKQVTEKGNNQEGQQGSSKSEGNLEGNSEGNSVVNDNKGNGEYELTVYKSNKGELCIYNDCPTYDASFNKSFTIKVTSTNARLLEKDENNTFILYSDNVIKIYDVKNNRIINTDLEGHYNGYDFYLNEAQNKVVGITFRDNNRDKIGYYNVTNNKKMYTNKYNSSSSLTQLNDNYLSLSCDSCNEVLLLSTEEEKVLLNSPKNDENNSYSFGSYGKNGHYIFILSSWNSDESSVKKMYNNEFKEFYSGNLTEDELTFVDNNVYLFEKKQVKKYNLNGNLISSSKEYSNMKTMIRNYIVYIKDGNLVLENIDDATEFKVLTKWNDKWNIHFMSGYYTRETLDEMDEGNKKEGLYVVIEYPSEDSNGNYGIEYCYTPDRQIVEYVIKDGLGGRAKPVLYLYPETETNVTVTFYHPEYLTTTYPKYIDSWNVIAKPNGDLTDKNGKYYYALYWDEKRYNEVDFKEGFYVEGKDAIKFLEEKLTIIGLNDKERNEFIMYWLPIMENNKKNLVYFELTEERELGNKLIIEPKPDSLLRVSIHIKKVNEKTNIKEQELKSFTRVGFTAVEWGGMTY